MLILLCSVIAVTGVNEKQNPDQTIAGPFRLPGGLRVDRIAGLIEGAGGCRQVDPKVMDVLGVMVACAGQVVSRDQFFEAVWPGQVVTEDAISRCIYQLRAHLEAASGDESARSLIETLPRRGYRLNATPQAISSGQWLRAITPMSRSGAVLLLALTVALLWWWSGKKSDLTATVADSIVVMPFVDLSADGNQAYFAEGIAEELRSTLAGATDLRVIARSSSVAFRDQHPGVAILAEKLGVSHVLEGSVRTEGDRVRVSAQLIDAANSLHLWSETFHGQLGELFAIQDQIARAVSSAMGLSEPVNTGRSLLSPVNEKAYALIVQGEFFFNRRAAGDMERAKDYFLSASSIDADSARALAGLAGVYMIQVHLGEIDEAEGLPLMGQAAARAVAIDPGLPAAQFRLAAYYGYSGDSMKAAEHFDLALELGPDDPLILAIRSGRALRQGDFDDAIRLHERAMLFDPLSAILHGNQASTLLVAGRIEESRQAALRALELIPADQDSNMREGIVSTLVKGLVLGGLGDEALSRLDGLPENTTGYFLRALVYDSIGQPESAALAIEHLLNDGGPMAAIHLAELQAHFGAPDQAFEWLDQARNRMGSQPGRAEADRWIGRFMGSPFLWQLRADPRWAEWLAFFGIDTG